MKSIQAVLPSSFTFRTSCGFDIILAGRVSMMFLQPDQGRRRCHLFGGIADSYQVRLGHKLFLGYVQIAGFANALQIFQGDAPKVDFEKFVGFDRQKCIGIQEVMAWG